MRNAMHYDMFSAFCVSAPRSGEGKTTITMGLMRALTLRGLVVQGFKCGPDYIDPTFHALATGRASYNVDTWMMGCDGVERAWARHTRGHAGQYDVLQSSGGALPDVAVCEGAMGLFDGCAQSAHAPDLQVTSPQVTSASGLLPGSTAHCAVTLHVPVILVVNARGMATSLAALVKGFVCYQPQVRVVGVIANGVGSERHYQLLQQALEQGSLCDTPLPPLLGALPRNPQWALPERQLGLVPSLECGLSTSWLDALAQAMEKHVQMDRLLALTHMPRNVPEPVSGTCAPECVVSARAVSASSDPSVRGKTLVKEKSMPRRMAVAKDKAFCFYYEDNEAVLQAQGWDLVPFSPLYDTALPPCIEAVYLGGGYPEEFAQTLAANTAMREAVRVWAQQGAIPQTGEGIGKIVGGEMYAECGGYMYLCRELITADGQHFPMCGVIDGTARMGTRMRSLGYREARMTAGLPFGLHAAEHAQGMRGHEFHWSEVTLHRPYPPLYRVTNGSTPHSVPRAEGVAQGAIRAGYLHLYWGGLGTALPELHSKGALSEKAVLDEGVKPVLQGVKPTLQGVKPALEGVKPALQGVKPALQGVKPALDADTPLPSESDFKALAPLKPQLLKPQQAAPGAGVCCTVAACNWVIVLNGPSSAGKTTLGRALQRAVAAPTLLLSVDSVLGGACGPYGKGYGAVHACVQATNIPVIEAFHGAIEGAVRAGLARTDRASIAAGTTGTGTTGTGSAGVRVIVDHVPGDNPLWRADLLKRLDQPRDFTVLYVQVTCSREVLRTREQARRDRAPDVQNALRQQEGIHETVPGQCVVDTTTTSPEACTLQVLACLKGMLS